jgi:hypothetical protein
MINDILDRYQRANDSLVETADLYTEEQFFKRPAENKWSAAEIVEHLVLVTKPMVALFSNPGIMAERWGTIERPSRDYEELAEAYIKATGGVGKSPERAVPQATEQTKAAQLAKFKTGNGELVKWQRCLPNLN